MKSAYPFSRLTVLLSLVLGAVMQPAWADVQLKIVEEIRNSAKAQELPQGQTPGQPAARIPGDTKATLDVTLGGNYITVQSARQLTIYDFGTRRRIVADVASKTFVDYSLFDTIRFRMMELQSREQLLDAVSKAKVDRSAGLSKVDSEQILSVQGRDLSVLDVADMGDTLVFSINKKELAHWSKKGEQVSNADAARFVQFLRYFQGGHPQVLDKLERESRIPGELVFDFAMPWGDSKHVWSVQQVEQVKAPAVYDLQGYSRHLTPASNAGVSFDFILDRVVQTTTAELERAKQANRDQSARDISAGNYFDVMLGVIEWGLMTTDKLPPFTAEEQEKINNDPTIQKMTALLAAKTDEQAAAAAKTLVELRAKSMSKAYMLKYFEANYRMRIGQTAEAGKLLREALLVNPLMAGAYKDLGDYFNLEFDAVRAGRSWDAGRRLAPGLATFLVVNKIEQTVVTQHPEYF